MRKLLAIALLISGTMFIVSCSDDEGTVVANDAPTVTIQPTSANVEFGATGQSVTFNVTVDSDLTATWAATSSNANITITTASGDVDGATVVVPFDAAAEGLASITLTVTDSDGETASASTAFEVLEEGDADVTITGIPATAVLVEGATLTVPDVNITSADGLASFVLSVNDGADIDLIALIADADLVVGATSADFDITATTTALGAVEGNNTLVFTATDNNMTVTSFTHVLTVEGIAFNVDVTIDDNDTEDEADDFVVQREISGTINTDFTITNAEDPVSGERTPWILGGRVKVTRGATLTIEAGTVIKAQIGAGANASALLVASGSSIVINGTAERPVIMTSVNDLITPDMVENGEYASPNLLPTEDGLWGGLIVLGDAPISASATQVQIEGIPATDEDGLYGGSNEANDAGTIRYLSLRHGGSNIGQGNEINGITFGGAGSGTDVSWVEVVANQDDGIEWFGGNVDVSNALIWNSGDDSMDSDQDWQGTMDGFIIVTPDGSAFELDGPEGAAARNNGAHTFTNGTVYAGGAIGNLVDWDDNTNAGVNNVYFYGITEGFYTSGSAIASFGGDGNGTTNNWQITLAGADTPTSVLGADGAAITTTVPENDNTVGVDGTGYGWTFASADGALFDIGLEQD